MLAEPLADEELPHTTIQPAQQQQLQPELGSGVASDAGQS